MVATGRCQQTFEGGIAGFGGQHRGNITGGPIAASILLTRSWCRSYRAALAEKEPDDEREGDSNARQIRYSRWAVFLRCFRQCGARCPSHIVDRRVRASEGQRSTHLVGSDDRHDPPEP